MHSPHTSSAVAVVSIAALALLAGCSSSKPQEITGPAVSMSTQRAVPDELQAPPGPFDHWAAPRIRIATDGWKRQQKEGGISLDPSAIWEVEVPAEQEATFEWSARPRSGQGEVLGYRWALDIEDITDETPRLDDSDLAHWSAWSPDETSVTLGPFAATDQGHVLSVEALDDKGFVSLVTLDLRIADLVRH